MTPIVTRIQLTDPIFKLISELADRSSVELYVVGGYVRDLLLGKAGIDIDFSVVGNAIEFARVVAAHFGRRPVIFERFGTAMVPAGSFKLEFVGTRREVYGQTSRKPVVTEGTIDEDLKRRDFTINACAIRLGGANHGELIDLFGGVADIEAGVLRTPLDPNVTYWDDPLRMMRAARFSSQLGFTIEAESLAAIGDARDRIEIVSQERISDEFLKLLASPRPSTGLTILYETGIMERIFPEVHRLAGVELVSSGGIAYAHKDVFRHTLRVVDNTAAVTGNLWLRFAALMHDIAKPATKRFRNGIGWSFHGHEEIGARWQKAIFRRLKLPMREAEYVARLVRLHHRPMVLVDSGVTDSAIRRLIVDAADDLDDLIVLCRADITSRDAAKVSRYLANYDRVIERIRDVRERDALRSFQSPVRGDEIMNLCGLPPSRAIGTLKCAVEEAILSGTIPNEYSAAKAYLMKIKDEILTGLPESWKVAKRVRHHGPAKE